MLKLALEESKRSGIKEALLTCDKDNLASTKTILANVEFLKMKFKMERK